MATKIQVDDVVADATQIVNVWTANGDFKMGDVTLAKLKSGVDALREADDAVESKRTELTGLINERDTQATQVNQLVTRARSGIRAVYGPDSKQYEQAGGTRSSARKRPVRKNILDLKKAA